MYPIRKLYIKKLTCPWHSMHLFISVPCSSLLYVAVYWDMAVYSGLSETEVIFTDNAVHFFIRGIIDGRYDVVVVTLIIFSKYWITSWKHRVKVMGETKKNGEHVHFVFTACKVGVDCMGSCKTLHFFFFLCVLQAYFLLGEMIDKMDAVFHDIRLHDGTGLALPALS